MARAKTMFRQRGSWEAAQTLPLDRPPQHTQTNLQQRDLLYASRTGRPWRDPCNLSSKKTMPAGT
eukprot:120286-Pyramimonas_sp.AAC.1